MENERKRSNTILLTVIAIATLLVAVVGATFAYFSVTISGNTDASSIIIKTAQLGIIYDSGDEILGTSIMPGWTDSKTFSVENTGNISMTYKLVWVDVENSFVTKSDLLFSLASSAIDGGNGTGTPATLGSTIAPSTGESVDLVPSLTIPAKAKHNYTLTLSFINDESSIQNDNQNKTFMAKINVISDPVTSP